MKHLKTLFMVVSFGFCLASSAQYKNFEGVVHLGVPTGEVEDFINIVYGLELTYYLSNDIGGVIDLGFTGGFTEFNYDTQGGFIDGYDASFLKIAASGKLNFQNNIYFSTDLGYAIGLDQVDGGLYFSPKIGYHFDSFLVQLFYNHIRNNSRGVNDADYSSLGVGFGIRL
ncbi:MAG: hypothetical protein R6V37_06900 [Psychroflexus maritimus]